MYRILLKMKKIYNRESWLKMVEQAKDRRKITEEEYQELTKEKNDTITNNQKTMVRYLRSHIPVQRKQE